MITGEQLRDGIISGANNITKNKSNVDELNVFPVPDGDTGTNMSMTINAALPELRKLPIGCTVEKVAQTAASALLRGARGNSGVILSLLFRGFSRALIGKATASSEDLYNSLTKGVESAYKAVMKPTEGTILTVARVASEQAAEVWDKKSPLELWEFIVDVCKDTLAKTPELLPVLKKAGVVDAGGCGLVVIFEGMLSVFKDGVIVEADESDSSMAATGRGVYSVDIDPEMTNSYCTEFLVIKSGEKEANDIKLRAYLESIGDSVVVVDDEELIKCHVHTANPGKALGEALNHGYLSKIKIENMLEQFNARQQQGAEARQQTAAAETAETGEAKQEFLYAPIDENKEYGFVSVSSGDGLKTLFEELGVNKIVSGGQTMNPSTEDILCAIQSIPAKNVIVLANNKNIIMAAEQACKLADRSATVVPSRTIPQGISAMLAFDEAASVKDNIISMSSACDSVTTGQVTFAARDSDFDGHEIKEGEILGIVGGKLSVVGDDISKTAVKLARKITSKSTSFVTVIFGAEISEQDAEAVAQELRLKLSSDIEVTVVNGGQPVYYYYISAE